MLLFKTFLDFKINHLDCPANTVETLTYGSYTPVKTQYLSGDKITYSCNSQFTLESSTMLTRECTSGQFEPRFSTANLLCNPGIFMLIIKKLNIIFIIKSRHILFFGKQITKLVFKFFHMFIQSITDCAVPTIPYGQSTPATSHIAKDETVEFSCDSGRSLGVGGVSTRTCQGDGNLHPPNSGSTELFCKQGSFYFVILKYVFNTLNVC